MKLEVQAIKTFALTLTEAEARQLHDLLGSLSGGGAACTPLSFSDSFKFSTKDLRSTTDKIWDALDREFDPKHYTDNRN